MFYLNLNGSTRSVDLSILNSSALDSPALMMNDLQSASSELGASHELTKKYYPNVNLSSLSPHAPPSSDSPANLSTSSSSPTNLVHQLTTIVNDLVIDTLLTNSTPSLLSNGSSNNSFNQNSSELICMRPSKYPTTYTIT